MTASVGDFDEDVEDEETNENEMEDIILAERQQRKLNNDFS
jgi:hypothetical protein